MYHALDHLTGNGLLPSAHDFNESYFVEFDQNIYYSFDGNDAFAAAMGDIGYIFVPPRCYDYTVKCKLHVYFHGCGMNVPRWGYETWLEMVSGFFDVGTTNDIVILFPQVCTYIKLYRFLPALQHTFCRQHPTMTCKEMMCILQKRGAAGTRLDTWLVVFFSKLY